MAVVGIEYARLAGAAHRPCPAICGVGAGLSGMRDAFTAIQLGANAMKEQDLLPIHFRRDKTEIVLVTVGPA